MGCVILRGTARLVLEDLMKKQIISAMLALVMLGALPLFTSCSKAEKFTEHSLELFDTATTITGYERDEEDFKEKSAMILGELEEYHKLFDIYHKYDGMENLCSVNELYDGAHREVTVDQRIIDMLLYAKAMHKATGGAMNVAMGSVLSLWHEYRTAGLDEPWAAELPPRERLEEAALHTDIEDVIIDEEAKTVFLADPEMSLDVGAVAKGYAVEMVAQALEADGVAGYVINVGGNVRTVGAKSDEERWVVGIEDPEGDEANPYLVYLELAGETVVTSGSYQRFYTVGDKEYHHIIDQETLMPADKYVSVSVVSRDSAQADALSTALFCMSLTEGLMLVEQTPNCEALWVFADGSQKTSTGFNGFVKRD